MAPPVTVPGPEVPAATGSGPPASPGSRSGTSGAEKDRARRGLAPGVSARRHDQEDVKGPSRLSIRWTGTGDFGDSWVDMKRRLKPLPKTRAEHPWRIRRESDDDVADREDPILSLGARLAEPAESP